MEEKLKLCLGCMEEKNDDGPCIYCGYSDSTPYLPSYLAPGTVLNDRYLVGKLLRYNGEGALYLAYDSIMKKKIWIKEYMPDTLCTRVKGSPIISVNQKDLAPYKTFMSEFTELNKLLAKMRTLNHINPALELFAENNSTYVTFDVIDGITLKDYLQENAGELSWEDVKKMFPPIFTTLSLIHNAGIIHRGISPETIWVCNDNSLKLTDFSITASRTNRTELAPFLYAGYAAPEQYSSSNWQGTWTDVYAISAVLYRMLTGCMPTEAVSRIGNDNLCEPASVNPNIPANVSKVIMNGMTLSGDMRIQTVTELVTKLFEQPDFMEPVSSNHTATIAIPRQSDLGVRPPSSQQVRRPVQKKKKAQRDAVRAPMIAFLATVAILLVAALVSLELFAGDRGNDVLGTAQPTELPTAETSVTTVATVSTTTMPISEQTYEIPDFVGKNFELIQNSKTYKDWLVFVPTYEYNEEQARNTIIEQNIEKGTFVAAGASINVTVSMGPAKVQVPDYLGYQEKDYLAVLDSAGIKYEVAKKPDPGFVTGYVIQTDREIGAMIDVEAGEILIVYICDNGEPIMT